jgi:hypothetical protein
MRAGSQRQLISLVPRILIIVGVILILSSILDYLILLYPPNFLDRQWQLDFVSQLADRGIVPLVGLVFLFAGFWTAEQTQSRSAKGMTQLPLRLPALILATLLGLMFLVVAPLHWNNTRVDRTAKLADIEKQADNAKTQLEDTLKTQVEQEQVRINTLLKNEAQLNQAISSGQISLEQANLLQGFIDKPGSLDEYLKSQADEFRKQALEQIATRKAEADKQTNLASQRSGVRTVLTSLLLAIGYAFVGWTGLKEMRQK